MVVSLILRRETLAEMKLSQTRPDSFHVEHLYVRGEKFGGRKGQYYHTSTNKTLLGQLVYKVPFNILEPRGHNEGRLPSPMCVVVMEPLRESCHLLYSCVTIHQKREVERECLFLMTNLMKGICIFRSKITLSKISIPTIRAPAGDRVVRGGRELANRK